MDPLHLHLFLNHIPVVGGIGAMLLLAWGVTRRSRDITLAALVAFVIVGVAGIPVFITGDIAAERITDDAGRAWLATHEDAAIAALVGLEAAAAVAVCALFSWKTTRRYPLFAATATLILGIAASVLVVRAATLGGRVSHEELRPAVTAQR